MKKLAMFLGCGVVALAIGCGDSAPTTPAPSLPDPKNMQGGPLTPPGGEKTAEEKAAEEKAAEEKAAEEKAAEEKAKEEKAAEEKAKEEKAKEEAGEKKEEKKE